jgi:hypothetical protein
VYTVQVRVMGAPRSASMPQLMAIIATAQELSHVHLRR